ncbi:hypothetical protein DdX_06228 [Ditylenchus destructor]|uniref:Abnormal cell migration protein 18-like fibronectin type I domain-containing protein n=1 Tax=Ditylenchus destructor TaxID=166010 RepID=A0AAD4N6V4_9BILA|nr:hypothetical protein DdX_06228 [Ditylenchus destructor]
MRTGTTAAILMSVPNLPFCRIGQRFIHNYILYVCHQFAPNQRGFKPFSCVVRNQANANLVSRNSVYDDGSFLYKCIAEENSLTYQAINCIVDNMHINPGNSVRHRKTEFSCQMDGETLKRVEKRALHDFCKTAKINIDSSRESKCPGMSVGVVTSHFGNGTEVVYDTKQRIVVV